VLSNALKIVVAYKGQLHLLPEHKPAKFERIDQTGLREAGYGPEDFECVSLTPGGKRRFVRW
jgi:hypothetical protein